MNNYGLEGGGDYPDIIGLTTKKRLIFLMCHP